VKGVVGNGEWSVGGRKEGGREKEGLKIKV